MEYVEQKRALAVPPAGAFLNAAQYVGWQTGAPDHGAAQDRVACQNPGGDVRLRGT